MENSTSREKSEPRIQYNHVDGPLLTCSDGTLHWLTMKERMWLHFGFTSVAALDDKYKYPDEPQRG